MLADNLDAIVRIVTAAAVAARAASVLVGGTRQNQIAAGAAAAVACMRGGYDDGHGNNHANVAVTAGQYADAVNFPGGTTDAAAATRGVSEGNDAADNAMNLNGSIVHAAPRRNAAARAIGIAAATTPGNPAAKQAAAANAAFMGLRAAVPTVSRFRTGGLYRNTQVIDIGNTHHTPAEYQHSVAGHVSFGGTVVTAPGVDRLRTGLAAGNLGDEILWNSGPNAIAAPANSPAAFVVANNRSVWRAPANQLPVNSGQADNDVSIGLIVRFNRFFFYTAGDLPSQGDQLVANSVMNRQLPDPQNPPAGLFPLPAKIAAFKCGHHGSQYSTSNAFLQTALAETAFVSCGVNQFGQGENHPAPALINRLHGDATIDYFFLTNCNYVTANVPASNGNNQLVAIGNKSRVCGDNGQANLAVGRPRGDARLTISEAESTSNNAGLPLRQFHVTYFDDDNNGVGPFGVPIPVGMRTEHVPF
ncbi:MAG TPA: hypothetical protein VMF05_04740 [Stellaceae bacterium]|nr:hypothetical protein [Stellaceae bacterium]